MTDGESNSQTNVALAGSPASVATAATAATAEQVAEALVRAKSLLQGGRVADAIASLEALLDATLNDADRVEALYLLAVSRRYAGIHEGALQAIASLLDIDADHARAYQERGHTCLAINQPEPAREAYARAVELNPALAASWRSLKGLYERDGHEQAAQHAGKQLENIEALPRELVSAYSLLHQDKLLKAEQLCRNFLQRNKHHVEGMRLLAQIGIRLNVFDDPEFLLESCVELYPDHVPARVDYRNLLLRTQKFEKGLEQAQILLEKDPDNPRYKASLAAALVGLGRSEEGIACYRDLLRDDPDNALQQLLLGHALKAAGHLDEAIDAYHAAHRIRPEFGDAYWSLANTKTYRFSDAELERIVEHEQAAATPVQDRVHLCFAAGKAYEDRQEYDTSFAFYDRGNELQRQQALYTDERFQERVDAQIEACTAALFDDRQGAGFEAPDPIFIVGLPRSGSTLLEQILASHSMVDGTMELHDIMSLAQRLRGRRSKNAPKYPGNLHDLTDEQLRSFGERFIQNTRVYRGDAPFFTDKMPNNFLHIGLIRLILPNAKIIDARRHPMACCFSGFKQLFGEGQEFTYGLDVIGNYYRGYVRLMDHLDQVLPGYVLRVMHEDVVNDLETQVRRILDFCGLPFEESCLRFYETERTIRTPSSEQVKQPIYRSAVEQWRHYAAHLEPLRDALGPDILARYPD